MNPGEKPEVRVTLVNRKGYVRQRLPPAGEQIDLPDEWNPAEHLRELPERVTVRIGDRDVAIRAWLYDYWSPVGGLVPVLFLDTDLEENSPDDRGITDYLYGGDPEYNLKQSIVLGIGGVRMLEAVSFWIGKYHINESHSSLLTLELLKHPGMDEEKVRTRCIFTTRTPVKVAFETFPRERAVRLLRSEIPPVLMDRYIDTDGLSLTTLAFDLSKFVNGVSPAHKNYSQQLFPGFHIRAVTNGVHPHTWTSRQPQALTIGFARRAAAYKQATLIFSDLDKIREIDRRGAFQLIFAGKAHPEDRIGKQEIRQIHEYIRQLDGDVKVVYLENYTMDMAAIMTAGADVWLNTPCRRTKPRARAG